MIRYIEPIITVLEILGTIAFAASGALTAIKHRFDLLGIITVGMITATGGGMIRDTLVGIRPVSALQSPLYITIAVAVSIGEFIVLSSFKRPHKTLGKLYDQTMFLCDTIGLGIFTVTGITTSLLHGHGSNYFLLFFSGIITGVGGGILRDIIVNRKPQIFLSNIYASASAAGAVVFLLLHKKPGFLIACSASLVTTISLRMFAARFDWNLPKVERRK